MNTVKSIIDEHKYVHDKRVELEHFIYFGDTTEVPKADFANMCMQLAAMRQYENCLSARLENNNVVIINNNYFHKIDEEESKNDTNSKDEPIFE